MYKCDIILRARYTVTSNQITLFVTSPTARAVESEKLGSVLQTVQNTIDTLKNNIIHVWTLFKW